MYNGSLVTSGLYILQIFIPYINPCAAGTVYLRFKANCRLNKLLPKFVTYLLVDAQLIKYFNSGHVYFSQVTLFFIHLKLEIALAIPASNE